MVDAVFNPNYSGPKRFGRLDILNHQTGNDYCETFCESSAKSLRQHRDPTTGVKPIRQLHAYPTAALFDIAYSTTQLVLINSRWGPQHSHLRRQSQAEQNRIPSVDPNRHFKGSTRMLYHQNCIKDEVKPELRTDSSSKNGHCNENHRKFGCCVTKMQQNSEPYNANFSRKRRCQPLQVYRRGKNGTAEEENKKQITSTFNISKLPLQIMGQHKNNKRFWIETKSQVNQQNKTPCTGSTDSPVRKNSEPLLKSLTDKKTEESCSKTFPSTPKNQIVDGRTPTSIIHTEATDNGIKVSNEVLSQSCQAKSWESSDAFSRDSASLQIVRNNDGSIKVVTKNINRIQEEREQPWISSLNDDTEASSLHY